MGAVGEIPESTLHDLRAYLEYGRPPGAGGFLRRVLENRDVMSTAIYADRNNGRHLRDICKWIYNTLPVEAWGSKERVDAWIARRGKVGALP